MKEAVLCFVAPCSLAIAVMMEAVKISETSMNFLYHATRRKNPEDSHFHSQRRENLKYHAKQLLVVSCVLQRAGQNCRKHILHPETLTVVELNFSVF
jgi:hypothetical protein